MSNSELCVVNAFKGFCLNPLAAFLFLVSVVGHHVCQIAVFTESTWFLVKC